MFGRERKRAAKTIFCILICLCEARERLKKLMKEDREKASDMETKFSLIDAAWMLFDEKLESRTRVEVCRDVGHL